MSNDEELVPLIQFPDKLQSIFEPHPYKVYYGGRGSSKSWSIARALLILGAATTIRCLCAREYQKSIKESVHQILCDQIQALQLGWYYRVTDREIRNKYNGTLFLFEGLHANSHEIKSKEGLTHCWIEEAENVSKTSWDYLEPTLRTQWLLPWQFWPADTEFTDAEWDMGGRLVDPEIWVSFNPANETDFIYQKFVGGENPKLDFKAPPGSIVQLINWRDNPWFPNNLRAQKDHLAATDPDGYLHIWEGKPRKQSAAQVLRGKYKIEYFEPEGHWSGPYHGTDWGFATDPTAHVKCWVDDKSRRLYIEYEAYGIGVETDDTPALLNEIPDSALYVNRADSARPETISYCRRHGHPRIIAAEKWPGSIEDGVNYLRQEFHEIIIHPRCVHTIEEAKLWSYKVDKNTQDVLPQLEDKNNHCFDALRYALAPLIKGKVKFDGNWWRRWSGDVEGLFTIKMVTVTVDEVSEGAAELRSVFQVWGVKGLEAMYLLSEQEFYGTLPVIIQNTTDAWQNLAKDPKTVKAPSELWADAKSVGQTLIRTLRQHGIPAREWETEDKTILEPDYRAKLASVHLAAGRVFVPEGPCAVVTEIEGLNTNAMSLALLIWQLRGGGKQ